MIRLLLADDQALVRGALAALLELESDLTVVAQVGRGDEVLHAAREHAADVALLDVEMPGMDGITAAAELKARHPACRSLIVTTFGRPALCLPVRGHLTLLGAPARPGHRAAGRRPPPPDRPLGAAAGGGAVALRAGS